MTEKIYNFIVDYFAKNLIMPTTREIAEGVGVTSTSTVAYHIEKLIKDGKITKERGKNRAIKLVRTDNQFITGIYGHKTYDVDYSCDFTYINEDNEYEHEQVKWQKALTGVQLVELISRATSDRWFEHIGFCPNRLNILHYNPETGVFSKITADYRETI